MAKQSGKKIKATEIASLVLSGMDDAQLMSRYNISAKKLNSIFNKLIEAGFLEPSDLKDHNWTPPSDLTNDLATHALSYNPEETDTIEKTLREKEQTETILESVFQKMLDEGIVDGKKVADLKKSTKRMKDREAATVILSAKNTSADESKDVPTEELLDTSFGESSQATNKDFLATADIESLVSGTSSTTSQISSTTSQVSKAGEQGEVSIDEPYEPTIELARRKKEGDPSTSDEFLTTTELENIVKAPWSKEKNDSQEDLASPKSEKKKIEEGPPKDKNAKPEKKREAATKETPGSPAEHKSPKSGQPPKETKSQKFNGSGNKKSNVRRNTPGKTKKGKGLFQAPQLSGSAKTALFTTLALVIVAGLVAASYHFGLFGVVSNLVSSGYDATMGSLPGGSAPSKPGGSVPTRPAAATTGAKGKGPSKTGPPKNTPANQASNLMAAARKGDPIAAKQALERGANPNIKDKNGLTPLMIASMNNYPSIVAALLESNANPNLTSKDGTTALMMAAEDGFTQIVDTLISNGAITDLRRKDRATAMDLAAIKGHRDTLKALIDADANINARFKGKTPLMLAIENDHPDSAILLIDRGAYVNARDDNEATALLIASKKAMSRVVGKLCSNCGEVNQGNEAGVTPLMAAAAAGDADSINTLLDGGANLEAVDEKDETPLMYAVKSPDPEAVKILLEKGAPVDVKNSDGFTPLMLAADLGKVEAAQALLEKGADPSASVERDGESLTALNIAMKKGHAQVIDVLFGQDSSVESKEADLKKYLISAVVSGEVKVARALLEKGVDVNIKADSGEHKDLTPLHIAAKLGHTDMIKLLVDHTSDLDPKGPNNKTPFVMAFEKGHKEIMDVLAQKGANINAKGEFDNTPLITATQKKDIEMVKFLLEKGADPNAEGAFFKTALDYAVKRGDIETTKLLIEKGAQINRKARSDGKTPLMVAAEEGNGQMVQLLLDNLADKTIEDNIGYTAKKYALMNGHVEIVKLLSSESRAAGSEIEPPESEAPMSANNPPKEAPGN